jgi:hypothetical protein
MLGVSKKLLKFLSIGLDVVAYAYNPSNDRGVGTRIMVQGCPGQKTWNPI